MPLSAAIFMLLLLAGTSVVTMVHREVQRAEQRTALWAEESSPMDILLRASTDSWRGEQYPVTWIEPAGGAEPVLPPGMEHLPKAGQAVVSPALDRLASRYPALDARYPDRLVLGEEGIRSGGELYAYVRMPEGRTLAGEEEADRIAAFGTPSEARQFTPLGEPTVVSVVPVVAGVLGLLIFPGLIVLSVGLAAASIVRDHRFRVLRWIGAPRWMSSGLAVMETLMLAVPGLVGATIFWSLLTTRLSEVPLVGHGVVQGDLVLPWWLLLSELGVAVVITAVLSLAVTAIRQRGSASPRPGPRKGAVTPLRLAPLVGAIGAFVLAWFKGGSLAADLNLAGLLAAVVGVPLVLPSALRVIGGWVGRLRSIPPSLAGRGMEWDPLRVARPFAGGAALLVLVIAGSGFIAIARYDEASAQPGKDTRTVSVRWLDPRPGDSERLASALKSKLVVPTNENGDTLVIGASCPQLADYFPNAECTPGKSFELPATMEPKLTALSFFGGPNTEVRLTPAGDVAKSDSALVLGGTSKESLERDVRTAAMNSLPAPYVFSAEPLELRDSPLVPWIIAGLALSTIVLGVGCLLSLVDRFLGLRKHHRHLVNLGLAPRQLVTLEAWQFAVPYGTVVVAGSLVGVGICILMVWPANVPVPWQAVGSVLGIALIIGFIGTLSMALFEAKSVHENSE